MSSIQPSDFGSYRCIASNGLIRQSQIALLTEFRRPKITIEPSVSRIDLRHGQSIDLKCHIDDEKYKTEWYFDNTIIRNTDIHIASIGFNQSGIYKCIGRFEKYSFSEEILIAVHDSEVFHNEEKYFSQSILTGILGRSLFIDCQLPYKADSKISWTIINQSAIDNINFDYIDKNQYRLKINRIKEFHHNVLFKCYYQNKNILNEGFIKLNIEKSRLPPVVSYIPNNQTVPIAAEVTFTCQSSDDINVQWWFTPYHRPSKTMKISKTQKYRIETNQDLVIHHAEK